MNYELTRHAREVLLEREIRLEWMERVLNAADRVEPDLDDEELEHRLGRIQEYDNRVLRVIINRWADPVRVVTVYFDRAMRDMA